MSPQWALVLELDNLILNNYWRKFYTYKKIGWEDDPIHQYLGQKKNTMQIASFSTPFVNFAASSRRNRFYEIYNQLEMLDQDVPFDNSVEGIKKISQKYKIHIITSRTLDLEEKTREVLTRLGYPMEDLKIYFKKSIENLFAYRKKCLDEVHKAYPTGVGIALSPSDLDLLKRYQYTPIVFTSIKNTKDFNNRVDIVCHDWVQLCSSLQCE